MTSFSSESTTNKRLLRNLVIGILIAWTASIAFALQIKRLLTSSNFPVGTDPSFDIVLAFLLFLIFLFGLWMALRSWLYYQNQMNESRGHTFLSVIIILFILFVLGSVTEGLLISAGHAFTQNVKPLVVNEPIPSDSMTAFPTPINIEPTPTYDVAATHLSGNISSALDGLRVGDMSIDVAATGLTVESMQIHMYRSVCTIQTAQGAQSEAVDEHKLYLDGPITIDGDTFFANQNQVVIHGIFASSTSAHGTLYLSYIDPQSKQSCDLGNFDWEANPIK